MRNNLDTIKRTLDLYDPDRQTVVVGTAALALQGIKVPGGVPDVDTLSPKHHVDALNKEMVLSRFGNSTEFADPMNDDRVSLQPYAGRQTLPKLLPYQSFTEVIDERYDIDFYLAYARSIMIDDYRVVPVHDILEWKASIGREKDLNKVQKMLSRRSIYNYLSLDVANQIRAKAAESRQALEIVKTERASRHVCSYGCHDLTTMKRINDGYGASSGYGNNARKSITGYAVF